MDRGGLLTLCPVALTFTAMLGTVLAATLLVPVAILVLAFPDFYRG